MGMPVKPDDPAPGEDVFTEEDLIGDPNDSLAGRALAIDRAITIVAVLAFAMIAGGMVALGAVAAPVVFKLPDPLSGNTMGATFARFDSVAITCALIGLGAEVVRTLIGLKIPGNGGWLPRVRRYLAILLALGTLYVGLHLSPQIMAAYQGGVRRGVGAEGEQLERTHKRAESVGKGVVGLAVSLIALHILTLSAPATRNEEEDALAPLPPGPTKR